jgi:hypothetical protein
MIGRNAGSFGGRSDDGAGGRSTRRLGVLAGAVLTLAVALALSACDGDGTGPAGAPTLEERLDVALAEGFAAGSITKTFTAARP